MTGQETAKMVSAQAKGQARGIICRTMQSEDFERTDALEKLMRNLKHAYANFTFYEQDEVDAQKQLISPEKKPTREKAEKRRQNDSSKENVCTCCSNEGNEAQLFVEMNNSTNTSCVIPTFKDCTFHHCTLPDIKTSKIAEEGVVTPEAKEGVVTPEEKEESVVTHEAKEQGVVTPEAGESVATPGVEEKGVVSPGDEKQTKIQERSPETRRERQQNRRRKMSQEKEQMKNGDHKIQWIGMVYSECQPMESNWQHDGIDEENRDNSETSSGDSFKDEPNEVDSDLESKIVRNPIKS